MAHSLQSGNSLTTNHREKEKSLLTSLIIDFLLVLPDAVAAVLANSITLYANLLKCLNELLATFLSWITVRKISRSKTSEYDYGFGKFENLMSVAVAFGMTISFVIVLLTGFKRLLHPDSLHEGGATLGLILMVIGMCVNSWLWVKNYRIAKKDRSPIMESQWRLFRAKAFADAAVFLALVLSLGLKHFTWVQYVDPIASFIIAGFLIYSVYGIVSHSVYDLLDKTVEESVQVLINRELAAFYREYKAFHGVRSRRSGNNIFIELFLEFDGSRAMKDVQESINKIKSSLEQKIQGSRVVIAPTTSPIASS